MDVANTGDVYGEEAVLVFIGSGIEGKPHKLLKGFARASLQPGKAETVTIEIPKEDLRLYDPEKKDMIIPSDITVYVGKNIQDAENRVVKL